MSIRRRKYSAARREVSRIRNLNAPKKKHAPERTRRRLLGGAVVRKVDNHFVKLVKVRRKCDEYGIPLDEQPDLKISRTKRKSSTASVGIKNTRTAFHNPAVAIANAINDSLNPEKVLRRCPGPVRQPLESEKAELEALYGPFKLHDDDNDFKGFKVNIKGVIEERERAKLFLLPSLREMWIPKHWILEESQYFIRLPERVRRKIPALRIPPKRRLPQDEVKRRLLAKRNS